MPWVNGVYSRGYPSWSADAASNLPISATKFDTEDNDFATGLNNCLTKDGLNPPSGAMTWSLASNPVLTLNRSTTGGTVFAIGFTGGTNNPSLQFQAVDGTGAILNLSTNQDLQLAIQGTSIVQVASTGLEVLLNGSAAAPAVAVGAANTGLYAPANNELGFAVNGAAAGSIIGGNWAIPAPSSGATMTLTGVGGALAAAALALVTGASAYAQSFSDGTNTGAFIGFDGSHNLSVGSSGAYGAQIATNGIVRLAVNSAGNVSIAAPSSGASLTLAAGVAATYVLNVTGNSTSGSSYGAVINAGTTAADIALTVRSQSAGTTFLQVFGDGGVVIGSATGGDQGAGSINVGSLYVAGNQIQYGVPSTTKNANYSTGTGDSNGCLYATTSGITLTITGGATTHIVGTCVMFVNRSGGNISIAITADSMFLAGSGTTGTRTLANYGVATAYHVASGVWFISGTGLT